MAAHELSSTELHALFNILSHTQAYEEINSLQSPKSIAHFGEPLEQQNASTDTPSAPLIQAMIKRFILILPGLRDVSPDFWHGKIPRLFKALAEANLSESYDKGSIGIRKTLATAIAAMMEYCARGTFGGFPKREVDVHATYDPTRTEDVISAWDDFLQQLVYGDLMERLFERAATTDKIEDHEPLVQATHRYIFAVSASFLHYVLIVSPRGQSLLPLLARAKDLTPWFAIRQTLRVGNAATMLNGMIKILLAKMNMSTFTSFFGAERSDKGINLLQQIISTVLGWDVSELQKRASRIETGQDAPTKEQRDVLKSHCGKSREEQLRTRSESESSSKSLVSSVLSNASSSALSEQQHQLALEYLAVQLAIRDRQQLINVLCHHQPDLLTSSVQDLVDVYSPIIRSLHSAADLGAGTGDLQAFLHDLIGMSQLKTKAAEKKPPSVEDFVRLLHKHQGSTHRFLNQVLKNSTDLKSWYLDYTKHAASQYAQKGDDVSTSENGPSAAGKLTLDLQAAFAKLPEVDQAIVRKELDAYASYLEQLSEQSTRRMKDVLQSSEEGKSDISRGPGVFLAKWQSLLDDTKITPAKPEGPVRHGGDDSVREATMVDVDGSKKGNAIAGQQHHSEDNNIRAPATSATVKLLQPAFRTLLVRIASET